MWDTNKKAYKENCGGTEFQMKGMVKSVANIISSIPIVLFSIDGFDGKL